MKTGHISARLITFRLLEIIEKDGIGYVCPCLLSMLVIIIFSL